MRDILFRGKRKDNGEWVQGYFFKIWERTYILWGTTNDIPNMIEVIPETVGQFTGFSDKRENKIFEGHIVKILYTDWFSKDPQDVRPLDEYLDSLTYKGVVSFRPNIGWFLKVGEDDYSIIHGSYGYIEIIGNIHDNPELLNN